MSKFADFDKFLKKFSLEYFYYPIEMLNVVDGSVKLYKSGTSCARTWTQSKNKIALFFKNLHIFANGKFTIFQI